MQIDSIQKCRHNSFTLRRSKNNFDYLLEPQEESATDFSSEISTLRDKDGDHTDEDKNVGLLGRTCLNSKYSLRTQLMILVGSFNAISILLVIAVCIAFSVSSGELVKSFTFNRFDDIVKEAQGTTARYLAETLSPKLIPENLIQIIHDSVQDRFMGYPNHPGYDEDELVPFFDIESQRNKFPIIGQPAPALWDIEPNVNGENYMEHVQDRWNLYNKRNLSISTATGSYFVQGMCDPSTTDPTLKSLYPNCTEESNNVVTGGSVAPSSTSYQIHRKVSDLNPLFKSLFEYHQDYYTLGLHFVNGGSGAFYQFPHIFTKHWRNTSYESVGCDWLLENPNPYDLTRPIADPETSRRIQRGGVCRPATTSSVPIQFFNPLERNWCRDQAITPQKKHVHGPYFNIGSYFVTVGRAIYDPITSEFICCMAIDFTLDSLETIVSESLITENAHASIVRYDRNGTVLSSTAWNKTYLTTIGAINAGVSQSFYQSLYSLVNYSSFSSDDWNATEIRKMYENSVDVDNGYLISGYPIPPPPENYDPKYIPEFLVIVAVPVEEAYEEIYELDDDVSKAVAALVVITLIFGLVGLGVTVAAIIAVSHYLTAPLRYMNDVASCIINNKFGAGENDDPTAWQDEEDDDNSLNNKQQMYAQNSKCAPRTEINEVVVQFENMVSNFTSGSEAKSANVKLRELQNEFSMKKQFEKLYFSRFPKIDGQGKQAETKFQYNFDSAPAEMSLKCIHFGPTVECEGGSREKSLTSYAETKGLLKKRRGWSSSLFIWVVVITVIPFLITSAVMAGFVASRAISDFREINNNTRNNFFDYHIQVLQIYANHRAELASVLMEQPVRDLHIVTRYAGWLLLNGVQRTDSLTDILSYAEACKAYLDITQCEAFADNYTCDCAWDDVRGMCQNYEVNDSRYLQKLVFSSQSQDTYSNGDRNSTSYPNVAYSPETTAWWDNIKSLPGYEEGSLASGYNTTYARVRAFSAIPVLQMLYNQDIGNKIHLASYIGFEADGTFAGYGGCRVSSESQFENTLASEKIRPDICPAGKFGYDPRCRGWYGNGRELYLGNISNLHVTPPYQFSAQDFFAQSATAPLTNPVTREHLGQTLVDFLITPLLKSLNQDQTTVREGGFSLLITASSDFSEDDTIVAPGFSFDDPQPITDLLFANDSHCNSFILNEVKQEENMEKCLRDRAAFQTIVDAMKSGGRGNEKFKRTSADGSEENFYMAYAPVIVNNFSPVDSSNFSRGVEAAEYKIYSLAVVETVPGLVGALVEMERSINVNIVKALLVLVAVICITLLIAIYISYRMALSITEPMLYLLELIGYINRLGNYNGTLKVDVSRRGHSLEVVNVSKTLESMYRIIRSANNDFFAGDLKQAYSEVRDALVVYRNLNNKKGISIASNNLGNVMCAVYRTMEVTGEKEFYNFTKQQIIAKGIKYFHESIKLGEKAYDVFYETQGWSPSCLAFMQHLSNRYFNRAMFLLIVKDGHNKPNEIKELGLRDLQVSQDMDLEIVEEATQAGWGGRKVDKQFDVMMSRVRGIIQLLEMGYEDDYEIEDRLDDVCKTLMRELKKEQQLGHSDLFEDVKPAGRMQQVETELMRYHVLKGDIHTAAKIAIRMLVEDDFTLLGAQLQAVDVLIKYINSEEYQEEPSSVARDIETELLAYQNLLDTRCGKCNDVTSVSFESSMLLTQRGDIIMEAF